MFGNLDSRNIHSIKSLHGMMFIVYKKKISVFSLYSNKKINTIHFNFKNIFETKVINQSLVMFHESNCSIIKFKNNKFESSLLFNSNSIRQIQSILKYYKSNNEDNTIDFSNQY